MSSKDKEQEKTEAVVFDPFAETTSSEFFVDPSPTAHPEPDPELGQNVPTAAVVHTASEATSAGVSVQTDDTSGDKDKDSAPKKKKGKKKGRRKLSRESRNNALNTFRERRGTSRQGARAARGMVNLPFITPPDPMHALLTPEEIEDTELDAPSLKPGEIVAEQYEILGPIAHGGVGWIYLAQDHNVSDRYVVLKGMIDPDSAKDRDIVHGERSFLAEITDPGIVKIYNFIEIDKIGYIVMEYVGGPSLRQIRRSRGRIRIAQSIGYILKVLPALEYLHSRGVVYNDLKPDNIVASEDQVKLLDLGAVSGIGAYGHIYGTKGFQAPEIAQTGPSIESDLYTVGRTLASLIIDLPVKNGSYAPGIPGPRDEPLFRKYYPLYQFLLRTTHIDPEQRFHSVEDMRIQLTGVLREIIAVQEGTYFPHVDSLFTTQRATFGTKHMVFKTDQILDGIQRTVEITPPEVVSALPTPLTDRDDSGASLLAASSLTEPTEILDTLQSAQEQSTFADSAEIPLSIVRAQLDLGLAQEAHNDLMQLEDKLNDDWRRIWYSGVTNMILENYQGALENFSRLFYLFPGEPAPKLALAATAELLLQERGFSETSQLTKTQSRQLATALAPIQIGVAAPYLPELDFMSADWSQGNLEPDKLRFLAAQLYYLVWVTNPTTVSSAFGLARQLYAEGLVNQAVSVLNEVPRSSRYNTLAQLTNVIMLISGEPQHLSKSRIFRAARRLEHLPTTEPRLPQLQASVLSAALMWLRYHRKKGDLDMLSRGDAETLLGFPFTEQGLRKGLAMSLRTVARLAPFPEHRYELIDMVNKIRPRTLF